MNQNKVNSKILMDIKLSLIKLFNFSMVTIFLLISILQPLSASSIAKTQKGAWYAEKTTSKQYNYQYDVLLEEETAEEDEFKQDHSALNPFKSRLFSFQEIHYTASLKTRYLNLVSSRLHTIETPLIVLYHTWKSDLV